MFHRRLALCSASMIALTALSGTAFAQAAGGAPRTSSGQASSAPVAAAGNTVGEVVVTANKRQQNIQNVGASVVAASGDSLTKLGITDTTQLQKIVPGFNVTPNYYGTNVFTIRGVGFQDTSLASSPTVTVYMDEAPLPFSILTAGTTLDLQRVEVLKGPQGTLFGNNATGGAINYIANKPTDTFEAGLDTMVGNFGKAFVTGFVSGPLTNTLDARLALQSNQMGAWQRGYGPQVGQSIGGTDFLNGRFSLQWKPTPRFKALLTVQGWRDRSYNQIGQYAGSDPDRNQPLDPLEASFPLPPHNDQAAAWQACVNNSPFDPITGQTGGTLYYTPYYPNGTKVTSGPTTGIVPPGVTPPANVESEGAGSLAQTGGLPTSCQPPRRNNTYVSGTLRMDYDFGNNVVVTSLTEYQKFNRDDAVDGAGVPYNSYQSLQKGKIESVYQELRVAGRWFGKGSWIVGANFEYDNTYDRFLQTYNGSQSSPVALPGAEFCGPYNPAVTTNACTIAESATILQGGVATANPAYNATLYPQVFNYTLGPTAPTDRQQTYTYAVYASGEYPIWRDLTLIGGVRFTQENKSAEVCGEDGGDGTYAFDATRISDLLQYLDPKGYISTTYAGASQTNPVNGYISPTDAYLNPGGGDAINPGPGGCTLIGPGPAYQIQGTNLPTAHLNENNVAWKAGLNWKAQPQTLLYISISQGYKGGAFPTIAETELTQNKPATQEGLLSYEGGVKATWFDHQLQFDGAVFYYDYKDKQILGAVADPIFGALAELVNVPNSHVFGFEASGIISPHFLRGLTISPSLSYQNSRIDHCPNSLAATASGACINGDYHVTSPFPQAGVGGSIDVNGEHYPDAPVWEATIDAEYDWRIGDRINAFVGLNATYNSKTFTSFTWQDPGPHYTYPSAPNGVVYNELPIPAYTLLDVRAGVSFGNWRVVVWGQNVTNEYYWTSYDRVNDTNLKYTGMPTTYGCTISYRFH